MNDTQRRQYLDDVPTDIQDLIFDNRRSEAVKLLMTQSGLGKMQAMMEAGRIFSRMKEEFPDAVRDPSSGLDLGLTPRQKSVIAWTIIAALALAGATITFFGIRGLIWSSASKDWPSAEGRVIKSSVERRTSRTATETSRTAYHAEVSYEFTVEGTAFTGDRVAYGDYGRGRYSHASRIVSSYPKGKSVTVYYMAGDPNECLLEPGLKGQAFILPSIGLFILLIGGVLICAAIAVARDERKAAEQVGTANGG